MNIYEITYKLCHTGKDFRTGKKVTKSVELTSIFTGSTANAARKKFREQMKSYMEFQAADKRGYSFVITKVNCIISNR